MTKPKTFSGKVFIFSTAIFLSTLLLSISNAGTISPCLDCHDEYDNSLSQSSHSFANEKLEIACISCHVGHEEHLDDPTVENITNPALVGPYEGFDICSGCHFGKSESDFAHAGNHFRAGINCSGCHKIHNNDSFGQSLLKDKDVNETCSSCHPHQQNAFSLPISHPLESGAITCINCHNYFGNIEEAITSLDKNDACYDCHPEMDGPFLYEHEATRSFGLEDGGCLNCHNPHGSAFTNLLKEPAELVCQQCHVVPPGHATAHDSNTCLDCHIDIHGSDSEPHYLASRPTNIIDTPPCNQCHY